jgi:hypothetical protein
MIEYNFARAIMIYVEGWVALKVQTKNCESFFKVFCTERGGLNGDTCFMTDAIFPDDILFSNEELKCVDATKREYSFSSEGENGWTLWSKSELNRLIRIMRDEGMEVERIEDFFQHIRSETSVKN